MPRRDRAAAGLLSFFIFVAFTVELYFVCNRGQLAQRGDWIARGLAFYGRGDRGYYDHVSSFELGLESFNVFFTQFLNIATLYGIIRKRVWRYPVQIIVASYVCYSTTLYLLANHLAGYSEMPRHDLASMLIFYVPNLPWLLGNAWLALDAGCGITAAFQRGERVVPSI
ncbi:MAG TPA: emopamil-binding family protein [Bryobacteraceae bacterium]|nr:emopamil-binding family protein [Bryobacteraceae bacterium]